MHSDIASRNHALQGWPMAARPPVDPFAPAPRRARAVPFDFVLEHISALHPVTRPMFGCTAVYLDERIVFVLRQKGGEDDGVWVAYERDAEAQVRALLPTLEPIVILGSTRGWRKLSAASASFEADVLRACALLRAGETCLGKLPESRKKGGPATRAKPRARSPAPKAKR
jgi:hypothetical protein